MNELKIYEKVKILAEKKGTSVRRIEKDLGFGERYISKVDAHTPPLDNVKKIADYFSIGIDELIGNKTSADLKICDMPQGYDLPEGQFDGQLFYLIPRQSEEHQDIRGLYKFNGSAWHKIGDLSSGILDVNSLIAYFFKLYIFSISAPCNFSDGLNVFSKTAPVITFFNFVLTNAAPFPGFTCWNSTTLNTFPSISNVVPFLKSPANII